MTIKAINCYKDKYQSVETECEDDCMQHRILKVILKHDDEKVTKLIQNIRNKALGTNFNSAGSDGRNRTEEEQNIKSLTGFIAENIIHLLLVKYNKKLNKDNLDNIKIELDNSSSSINQIDIRINKSWNISISEKDNLTESIEVRSSFPFKEIGTTVCKTFDVLGAYINDTKICENQKDYYLRLLFELEYKEENFITYEKNGSNKINYNKTTINTLYKDYFDENYLLKKDLVMYFVGGATKEMMNNKSIAYQGTMESDIFNTKEEGSFQKLKLKNSLDAVSLIKRILSVSTNEHLYNK
ncbi:MAG: hypothetical protein DRG78_03640 [Epsilonproteobacteria bacterium]|nr:MAG: hypothetical protein DRG78_03640 [Campylobacterota bacterium]